MTWNQVFTNYWGQVTLLLLAVSYFIKRVFDNKSKKLEINHSLFQQNKIIAINAFFKTYAVAELMWNQLKIVRIVSDKMGVDQMDNTIIPPLNNFRQSILELKIYFKPDSHKIFEQILDNFLLLNAELMDIYFFSEGEETITHRVNRFDLARTKTFKANNKLIEQLCEEVKVAFK